MRFILDVHLPGAFAVALRHQGVDAIHLVEATEGALRTAPDVDILAVASAQGRILLTSDRSTVTDLLGELWAAGRGHSGVIFVDKERFPAGNVGGFQRAILRAIEEMGAWDWEHRVTSLEPARGDE